MEFGGLFCGILGEAALGYTLGQKDGGNRSGTVNIKPQGGKALS